MASKASLLVDGKIPAGHVCPFRINCSTALRDECKHFGHSHVNSYSCGVARAFDIITPENVRIHGYIVDKVSPDMEIPNIMI